MEIETKNTWINAKRHKPPIGIEVLAKFADGVSFDYQKWED